MARIEGAGGEEWRSLETSRGGYDPDKWSDLVAQAEADIDSIRKREARVRLLDRAGRPLAGQRVRIVQTRSDFLWGFSAWGYVNQMEAGTFDLTVNQHCRRLTRELLNSANIMHYWAEKHCTNAPVSEEYQGCVDYDVLGRVVDWANAHGLTPKGHPLYWPVPKALPNWLEKYDYETRMRFLEVRIRQITSRFKGRIKVYDAVNEMIWEPTLQHTAERHWPHIAPVEAIADEAAAVMGWAREEDPDACYTLNEYGIASGDRSVIPSPGSDGSTVTRHGQFERYVALIQELIRRGQAPDAMGWQTPPGDWDHQCQADTYNALGEATGLPVHITEFRAGSNGREKADMPVEQVRACLAEYLANTITVAFGNPHVEGFYLWGDHHMFDGRKPTVVYERLHELIRSRWMTDTEATTDDQGRVEFRGFTGEYSLRLDRGGNHTSGAKLALPHTCAGADVELRLPLHGAGD